MRYDIDSINKRKKKVKIIKVILGIITIIIIYNMILVGISIIDNKKEISIFGYKAYIITSDSMEKEISVGDVIIAKKVNEEEIETNDIITFYEDNQIITHRVVNINTSNGYKEYETKGDNNNINDNKSVLFQNIIGEVIIVIPLLGKMILFMKNQVIVLIIILIILLFCFYQIEQSEKREIRRRKKEIEKEKQ